MDVVERKGVDMKKTFSKIVCSLSVGLMGGTVFLPAVQAFADNEAMVINSLSEYTKDAVDAYNKTLSLYETAKKTGKLEDVRKAYEAFIEITPTLGVKNYSAYESGKEMDKIYFQVRELLYEVLPKEKRNEEILNFATKWQQAIMKTLDSLHKNHFYHLVSQNNIEEIQGDLEDLWHELYRYLAGIRDQDGNLIPLPTYEEMEKYIDEYIDKIGLGEPDPPPTTEKQLEEELNRTYPQLDGSDLVGENITYEKIGGDWYQVIETIVDGKVIKTEKRKLSLEESFFLRVQEDPSYTLDLASDNISYVTEQEWNHYTSDQNPESKWTIHYTINKNEKSPYYYDTGIRVDASKSVTFEQYKDVLMVIADKAGGFLVEDKGKILVVLEGKPLVIYDSKPTYSKQELESLFEDFETVDIRIMETSIGKVVSLEEKIVSRKINSILVDGKEITLQHQPIVRNERAMFPLEELVYALGGTISGSNGVYTATKNGNNVVFQENENLVHVNGKAFILTNKPVYQDQTLMVEANELATAFGYSMIWDEENSTISFEKR